MADERRSLVEKVAVGGTYRSGNLNISALEALIRLSGTPQKGGMRPKLATWLGDDSPN